MQIGDLNVVNSIIELEIQVMIQGRIIDKLIQSSSAYLSQDEVAKYRKEAQEQVKKKYPALGISFS
jgi:hypothetical protein